MNAISSISREHQLVALIFYSAAAAVSKINTFISTIFYIIDFITGIPNSNAFNAAAVAASITTFVIASDDDEALPSFRLFQHDGRVTLITGRLCVGFHTSWQDKICAAKCARVLPRSGKWSTAHETPRV
ncbi:hypothetical protein PF010_g9076 [Phytophthora fragariae]|uniref:Uncharacterized protein n=1 Tax=Phytophthora fragariae TaxID=53985 RepID=A0A6G0LCM4_9STRA|nr:hypothetical protein PF010_g9076 [Phytophthora fragariae]